MLYNKVEQDFWIKKLSQQYDVEESFLREELTKKTNKDSAYIKIDKSNKNFIQEEQVITITRDDKFFELLFSISLRFPQNFDYIVNNLSLDFIDEKYRDYYNLLLSYRNDFGEKIDYNGFLMYIEKRGVISNQFLKLFLNKIGLLIDFYFDNINNNDLEVNVKKDLINIILEIKKSYYKKMINNKKEELFIAEKNNNTQNISLLLDDLKKLNEDLKKIE